MPSQDVTRAQRMDTLFAEVNGDPIYDRSLPTIFYTDGSCTDNGRPFAAAGWGVCVHNSDKLAEFYGALPGAIQSNNRAELVAVEAALQLVWNSNHQDCRVRADCNLACLTIDNTTDEWSWRSALGVKGWLSRWEKNGCRAATGGRVSHSDIWRHILHWLRLFRDSPDRCVRVSHVKAHDGTVGNERADVLAKAGADLRFKLMEEQCPAGWYHNALSDYWLNRKPK